MKENEKRQNESPQETFRNALVDQLRLELIGPSEPGEVIDESPRQRYSAGILFPCQQMNLEIEDENIAEIEVSRGEEIAAGDSPFPEVETSAHKGPSAEEIPTDNDDTITMANTYMPSAMGISFICDDSKTELIVRPKAAVYKSEIRKEDDREFTVWRRTELELTVVRISLGIPDQKNIKVTNKSVYEDLIIRATVRRRNDGSRLITASLYNAKQSSGSMTPPGDCFYQAGFRIEAEDQAPVFRPYQELTSSSDDPEEQGLRLLFRNRLSFGLGHGCAVSWRSSSENRAWSLETDSLPTLKIPPVEPRQTDGEELSMIMLAGGLDGTGSDRIPGVLSALADDYEAWIRHQEDNAKALDPACRPPSSERMQNSLSENA